MRLRRSVTCCASGRASATRGGRATCTPRRSGSSSWAGSRAALDGLLALPGIGSYTARALLAFAFEIDAAVVDTNIARVYARVAGERLTPKRVQAMADDAAPLGDAWVWNQCLMDLGAVLCRPANPACEECPVARRCAWRRAGGDDPAIGSSGVSGKQARFDGSDRQARGRLMRALTAGPVRRTDVAAVMQRDEATAQRLLADLIGEGLCQPDRLTVRLPH